MMGVGRVKGSTLRVLACKLVGAMLILAGIGLIAIAARSVINYHPAASRYGGEIVDLGAHAKLSARRHGSMVRLVETPTVVEAPHDPEFNVRVNTPVLVRHVEMFQWREVRIGAGVHYELDWVDRLLDAGAFEHAAGHTNPPNFPISSKQFDAGLVQMGGFKLSPLLLHALPGSGQVAPDLKSLPANLAASFSDYQGYLVTSAHPGDPQLGDIRVSWNEVPLQTVTIVARIDGDRLVAASGTAEGHGYGVAVGDVPLFDMFPDLPVPPKFVLGRRILAVLLAALGALLLLSARRTKSELFKPGGFVRDAVLALALGALAVGSVASLLWLGSDTQMMFGWLVVALLGMLVTIWCPRRRT